MWRGKISIFKTGSLEVGYSTLGPSLALQGTLLAHRKDVFVREILISVTRDSDGSTHELNWTAFRSPQVQTVWTGFLPIEIPSAFNVQPNKPHRYHIYFSDRKTQAEITPILIDLSKEWIQYKSKNQDLIDKKASSSNLNPEDVVVQMYGDDFTQNTPAWQSALRVLDRKNYWEIGSYHMHVKIKTALPNRRFTETMSFSIDEASLSIIRMNAVATLDEVCLGKINYLYAFIEYE